MCVYVICVLMHMKFICVKATVLQTVILYPFVLSSHINQIKHRVKWISCEAICYSLVLGCFFVIFFLSHISFAIFHTIYGLQNMWKFVIRFSFFFLFVLSSLINHCLVRYLNNNNFYGQIPTVFCGSRIASLNYL